MTEKNTRMGMTPEKAAELFSANSNLKKMRVRKGLSQQDLADTSNVPKRAIQTYEQGSRNIDKVQLETLCKLALALDCRIEDVLEDENLKELYKRTK